MRHSIIYGGVNDFVDLPNILRSEGHRNLTVWKSVSYCKSMNFLVLITKSVLQYQILKVLQYYIKSYCTCSLVPGSEGKLKRVPGVHCMPMRVNF